LSWTREKTTKINPIENRLQNEDLHAIQDDNVDTNNGDMTKGKSKMRIDDDDEFASPSKRISRRGKSVN
jgi:hypothetical protein